MSRAARRGKSPIAKKPAKAALATSVYGVTHAQYEKGWEMFETAQPGAAILNVTRMTERQLVWCARVGDEAAGMPSWQQRYAEKTVVARARSIAEAAALAEASAKLLERARSRAFAASDHLDALQTVRSRSVQEVMEAVAAGTLTVKQALVRLTIPQREELTVKALRDAADVSKLARAFRDVFDSPFGRLDPVSGQARGARVDLSAPTTPAMQALLSDESSEGDASDPLDTWLPGSKAWTAEQCRHFAETGEHPRPETTPAAVIDVEPVPGKDSGAP